MYKKRPGCTSIFPSSLPYTSPLPLCSLRRDTSEKYSRDILKVSRTYFAFTDPRVAWTRGRTIIRGQFPDQFSDNERQEMDVASIRQYVHQCQLDYTSTSSSAIISYHQTLKPASELNDSNCITAASWPLQIQLYFYQQNDMQICSGLDVSIVSKNVLLESALLRVFPRNGFTHLSRLEHREHDGKK